MKLLQAFTDNWQKIISNYNTNNCHLLLAVSGGVDSVVLTDLVYNAGFDFTIAHCNFQLRGADSERDATFVLALGEKYGKQVLLQKFDTADYAVKHKLAIQEAARNLRYSWFEAISFDLKKKAIAENAKQTAVFLVTAHHADDNIETVLMHFFRGTGIQGMRGILPVQLDRFIVRPLLPFKKEMLIQYATENGLPFVEDISNASDKYTRNFFRNQLIPQIKTVFPQADENILQNIERLRDVATIYQEAINLQLQKLLTQKGTEWQVPILKLMQSKHRNTLVWEIIKQFGFSASQINEVVKLLSAVNGSSIVSDTHRIIRNRNWLLVAPNQTELAAHIIIEKEDLTVVFENGVLQLTIIEKESTVISNDANLACLNADHIQFPLLLRKCKTGDYFYPLGMQKKKKLSRFFIDQKLSKTAKEKVWVLECNQKIIWVVGLRIDDRFKVNASTQKQLHIHFVPQ